MAISRPVTQTTISTGGWGIPITDQVNALQTWQTAMTPTPWVNVTFLNGWGNFSGYVTKYRKIGDVVYLQGGVAGGAIGAVMFILPSGFLPANTVQFAQPSYGVVGVLNIDASGAVFCLAPSDVRFVGTNCVFATT